MANNIKAWFDQKRIIGYFCPTLQGNNRYSANAAFVALLRAQQLPARSPVSTTGAASAAGSPAALLAPTAGAALGLHCTAPAPWSAFVRRACRLGTPNPAGVQPQAARISSNQPASRAVDAIPPCASPLPMLQLRAAAIDFAKSQIDYMLGAAGRSFVVGWGTNPPLRVRAPRPPTLAVAWLGAG